METNNETEDLGIKIGTKEEAAWVELKKKLVEEIAQSKRIILMDESLIKLADKKIAEEQKT